MPQQGSTRPASLLPTPMAQRTRRGCWTCKSRHKKCDETQPICRRCSQAGIQCEGYEVRLTWGSTATSTTFSSSGAGSSAAGPVIVGPARGARGARRPRRATTVAKFPPLPSADPDAGPPSSADCEQVLVPHDIRDNVAFTRDSAPDDGTAQKLLEDFVDHGYKTLTGRSGHATLLERGVIPLCGSSAALRHACIAVQASMDPTAARHLTPAYLQVALDYFHRELGEPARLHLDSTLAAGVLVCTVSVCLRGVLQHRGLLDRSRSGSSSGRTPAVAPTTPVAQHLFEVIALLDLPCLTINRRSPPLNLWRDHLVACTSTGPAIEQSTGLPYSLISIMADLDFPEAEARLQQWPGVVTYNFVEIHGWEAYRHAGILHSRILCHRRHHHHFGSPDGPAAAPRSSPLVPSSAVLRCRILASIQAVFDSGALKTGEPAARHVAYPLYIVGVLARTPQERKLTALALEQRRTSPEQDSMDKVIDEIVTEVLARTEAADSAAAAAAAVAAASATTPSSSGYRGAEDCSPASYYDGGAFHDDRDEEADDGGVARDSQRLALAAEIAEARNIELHLH
ncbi:hypothetical protein Micbo1qcDRAFT_180803 [Microdochium bolleyi]|uniref:Zn(2)-C6 fungal-type domain-containing protein n=1 Tax=Microdochium bolleyi TaxID=196109 RepID=A0A136IKR5_9PEZI|nr:hypothetical protein Micbo1qcDRAFT_180803 [Microdochium bolleyi]